MSAINYELLSEIIFTNDEIFDCIDIDKAKSILCSCKNASLNKNIILSIDRYKVREYFDKIFDVISNYLMNTKKRAYLIREGITESNNEDYSITSQLDEIIDDLKKENINVLDGFRELIVLEFKEFIYNYAYCGGDSYDIQYNLDYCIQYNLIINYFGYYEYYENHTYDPKHFMMTQDKIDYNFINKIDT